MRKPRSPADRPTASPYSVSASHSDVIPPGHRVPAHLARRFQQICLGIASEVTQSAGLTPTEYAVIAALDDAPDTDQSRLAGFLGMDPVSAHHILRRLEMAGLVERRIDPEDRRARVVRLTPQGHALRQDLHADALAAQDRILAPLTAPERSVFVDMLARLVQAHDAYAIPGNGRRRVAPPDLPMPSASRLPAATTDGPSC